MSNSMESSDYQMEYYHRATDKVITEHVYASEFLDHLYSTKRGQLSLRYVYSRAWANKIYGWYKASPFSKKQIALDIKQYQIEMDQFTEQNFFNYRDFFLRKFKKGRRPFVSSDINLASPIEGRYLGYASHTSDQTYPVKGQYLSTQTLLGKDLPQFHEGPMLIGRLSPIDYHYFHYPDQGKTIESYTIKGQYYPVSIFALKRQNNVFMCNERKVNILETKNFGSLIMIEVGAFCVGKIIQTHQENKPFLRGDEKGFFDFGASTVIIMGEKGKWQPSDDIIFHTNKKRETIINLGDCVGISK